MRTPESFVAHHAALRATGELILINAVMTLSGRVLFPAPNNAVFKVSIKSIHENMKGGWTWDDNAFSTNNFRHPYMGALYYNAGRDNGYSFFGSSMWAWLGSWLYEYTGETHLPALNDWYNTAMGGVVVGEVLHRFSVMVTDNTATGSGRTWREIGGFLVNPARGFNRLVTGAAFTPHANPEDRTPDRAGGDFRIGVRTLGDEHVWDASSSKAFIDFNFEYGDVFDKREKPFDHFIFGAGLNFKNTPHGIGRIPILELFAATEISHSEHAEHLIASYLHFDYVDNEAYTYGGTSVSTSLISKMRSSMGLTGRAWLDALVIPLGASKADYSSISGRDYDYGPGLGVKFAAGVGRGGYEYVRAGYESFFIRVVSGIPANTYVDLAWIRAIIPLREGFGIGVDYSLYTSHHKYESLPATYARNPEIRVSMGWQVH